MIIAQSIHFVRFVSVFACNDGGHTALLLLRDIRLHPEQSLSDILCVDAIVAVKNTPGLVATKRYGDAFRHTGAYHMPYRCPAQVMKELPRYACFLTRIALCFVETLNLHPTAMKDIGQQVLIAIPTHTQLGLRDRALAEVLCITGMRIAEALSLNRAQIDWATQMTQIIGKGNKPRKVYFTEAVLICIRQYLQVRHDDHPALFVTQGETPTHLKAQGTWKCLHHYAKRAGVGKRVYPHMLRHTMATTLNTVEISDEGTKYGTDFQ